MKLRTTYLILFLSVFLCKPVMAQYTQGKESLIAPSPTVAAIAKFGQIPVGYNTGIPNISIPLYTLKCGDLTLPISMEYHAGGIRVNDVASWVGLGWSLNVGGAINIAVQGGKDSYPNPDVIPIDQLELVPINDGTLIAPYYGLRATPYSSFNFQQFQNGPDTQPDIYNYQMGPFAGQFVIDPRDGKIYNVNGSKDVTFEAYAGPLNAFKAKDQTGVNYFFTSLPEETSNTVQYYKYSYSNNSFTNFPDGRSYGSTIPTALPLAKMVNANKTDSIEFAYNRMYEDYYTQMNGSLCWGMSPSRTGWTEYTNPFPNNSKVPGTTPENYSKVTKQSDTKKVSTIIASNGIKIVLTPGGATRTDLNDLELTSVDDSKKAKSLDKIEIYDANNNLIKKWEFVYDYFTSYITNPADDATNRRLKLVGLKEYGSTSANPQTYTFSYYGDAPGEPQLPYRNSFSGQDYWGYCNKLVTAADASNFKKAFPNIANFSFNQFYRSNLDITSTPQYISYSEGESKEANDSFLSAFSLKQITYPTGGNSTFEYESNVSYCMNDGDWVNHPGGGQRIKR